MMRRIARGAALAAAGIDLLGAWFDWRDGGLHLSLRWAALASALALAPCAVAFMAAVAERARRRVPRGFSAIDTMRLPLVVPRGYVGAAVLGGIATLAAMGENFGLYIFLAGVTLIALALSQAGPRPA